jgi:hypothetical protein
MRSEANGTSSDTAATDGLVTQRSGKVAVLTFFGYDLELVVDSVLKGRDGPTLWSGADSDGGSWLILEADRDPAHPAWLCAPISAPALRAIRSGRAKPRDAFLHSVTGTVELVRLEGGHAVPDQCLRCEDVPEQLLPPADWQLDAVGDPGDGFIVERRSRPRDPTRTRW